MGQLRVQCPACKHSYELNGLPAPNAMLNCERCGHRFPFRLTKGGPSAAAPPIIETPPQAARPAPLPPIVVPPTAPVPPSPTAPLAPVNVPPTSVVLDGRTLMLGGVGMLVGLAVLIVAIVGSVAFLISKMQNNSIAVQPQAAGNLPLAPPSVAGEHARKIDSGATSVGNGNAATSKPEGDSVRPSTPAEGPVPHGMLGFVTIKTPDKTLLDFVGAWAVDKRLWATHAVQPATVADLFSQAGAQMSVRTADGREFKVVRKIWHPKFEFDRFGKEKPTPEEEAQRLAHAVLLLECDADLPPRFHLADRKTCEDAMTKGQPVSASVLGVRSADVEQKLPMRTYNPRFEGASKVGNGIGWATLTECGDDRTLDGFPIVDENGRVVAMAAVIVDRLSNRPLAFRALSAERVREAVEVAKSGQ